MVDASIPSVKSQPHYAEFGDFYELLKPRVMSLVIFTAAVGLLVAPIGVHPIIAFASLLCIAVGAGASGALNMWWDADIDRIMKRTQSRPIPSGRVTSQDALMLGLWLSGGAVVMLALFANLVAAGLLAFTIFFYAVVYSMWLKRTTPQNIVIGGAAGAFPPMIGWAVATGGMSAESVLMFLVIFMWTPPHFWALALFMKSDYADAGVPMMTVVKGHTHTRKLVFIYAVILALTSLALGVTSVGGPVYLIGAFVLNAVFLWRSFAVWKQTDAAAKANEYAVERRLFVFSIFYLFANFTLLLVERGLSIWGLSNGPVWIG